MTALLIAGVCAAWVLVALIVLFLFTRTVGRADEENAMSSLRRTVRAADRAAPAPVAPAPWGPSEETGGISTRLHS